MADMTETLLSEAIVELKKGNQLREIGNRDPNLPSSIKQNLGEILNASRLAGQSEKFQEQTGITKTDDAVENLEKSNQSVLSKILDVVTNIAMGQPTQSQQQSQAKRGLAQANKLDKLFSNVLNLKVDLKKFTGAAKDFFTKGITGKATLVGLLTGFIFLLDSPVFPKLLGLIDDFVKVVLKVNKFLKTYITDNINRIFEVFGLEGVGDGIASVLVVLGGFFLLTRPIKTITTVLKLFGSTLFDVLDMLGSSGGLGQKGRKRRGRKSIRRRLKRFTRANRTGLRRVAGLGRGIVAGAKFIPFAGAIVTAGVGIFDGVKAGLEEAKNETATKGSIIREGISGALSGLTFGLVSQEGISGGLQKLGNQIESGFNTAKEGLNNIVTNFKDAIPTQEEVKEKIAGLGQTAKTKLTELGDTMLGLKDDLISKFEGITGIELPSFEDVSTKIKNFGKDLKERVLSFIPSKEKIKEFGGKVLEFTKNLVKDKSDQETVDIAVANALAKHFETEHTRNSQMEQNALNKMEGGQTTVVNQTTVDASNNSKMESVQHNMKQISHTDPTQLAVANAQ